MCPVSSEFSLPGPGAAKLLVKISVESGYSVHGE